MIYASKFLIVLGINGSFAGPLVFIFQSLRADCGSYLIFPCEDRNYSGAEKDLNVADMSVPVLTRLNSTSSGRAGFDLLGVWRGLLYGERAEYVVGVLRKIILFYPLLKFSELRTVLLLFVWIEIFYCCTLQPVFLVFNRHSSGAKNSQIKYPNNSLWLVHMLHSLLKTAGAAW